jgi:tight adherence protein B
MIMTVNPTIIISVTSALAVAGTSLLLVADRRERLNNKRVASVVRDYRPSRATTPTLRRAATAGGTAKLSNLQSYLGIRTDRPDLYPISWVTLLFLAAVAATVVVGIAYVLVGAGAIVALPFAWFFITRQVFDYFEIRRNKLLYKQLPDALAMIVRSVRVGVTVQDSLRVVAEEAHWPTSIEFGRMLDEIRVGASLSDALLRLAERSGLIEYRFFAVALTLQSQSGGSLSESLENLGDIVRKRVALRARAIALAAEARLTMYVLAGLPFFTTGALLVIEPSYLSVLVTTSIGKKILFGGLTLLAMGMLSMRIIIRKSTT